MVGDALNSMSDNTPAFQHPTPQWRTGRSVIGFCLVLLVLVSGVAGLLLYLHNQRPRDGTSPPAEPSETFDVDLGIRAKINSRDQVMIVYQDGQELDADGLGLAVVSKEDDVKHPERLQAVRGLLKDTDWPVVVFFNATGFDVTGEPVSIRRAKNGSLLHWVNGPARVTLGVARRDGRFTVWLHNSSGPRTVDEKHWTEQYMRLRYEPPPDPKELDKLSDEELRQRGFKRVVPRDKEVKDRPADKAPAPKEKGVQLRILPLRPGEKEKK